jgi:hypothetical protein
MKSDDLNLLDAVSCYESEEHLIFTNQPSKAINLYILGLGDGMEVNINNLTFRNPIDKIYVTIKNDKKLDEKLAFLAEHFNKAQHEIDVYNSCGQLIENSFH